MADNDPKIIKDIKYRVRGFIYEHSFKDLPTNEDGCKILEEYISNKKPFMASRLGANEARIISKWLKSSDYGEKLTDRAKTCVGIFPNDKKSIDKFSQIYSESFSKSDLVFTWGVHNEKKLVNKFCPEAKILRNSINQFLFNDENWTKCLKGKNVLVITPFVNSSKKQYEQRDKLFEGEVLPTFSNVTFIQTVQSSAGNEKECGFNTWFEALEAMEKQIDEIDFDIALISGGGYGVPLAAYVKSKGKSAIHLASSLQILFGIRGKRFDNWPEWTSKMNEFWIYPDESETPKGKAGVEGGSYWK